jgi:osmotically-inducible protein OsmY
VAALVLASIGAACAARSPEANDPFAQDERITTEVRRILDEDEDIVAEDLLVETRGGVVVISGVQSELEAVRDMLQRVARVRGVTEVVNRIRIIRAVRQAGSSPPASR